MLSLLLITTLQVGSADLSIAEAEALARRDEASLTGDVSSEFFDRQGKALGIALYKCGAKSAREAAGLELVMRLDAQGHVTKTWLNKATSLGQCFEKEIQSFDFPSDGRTEFYTFINFNY
jgi:hypothetical protein